MIEMDDDELDIIFEGTELQKTHPIFNRTADDSMLEVKKMGNGNNPGMVKVHSPFGKMIQETHSKNPNRGNIEVNCHKLLSVERTDNGTHFNYTIETFTSLKIKPNNGKMNPNAEQEAWGEIMVKNTFISNSTDLGKNLTDFTSAVVFLDSLSNIGNYELGEFIYSNSTDNTVNEKHIRQFNNYTNFANLGENVTGSDVGEIGESPLVNFNSTVRYYDNNGDGLFSANETVYHDIDNSATVTENDVRLANARFVDDRTDEPFVDGEKANFPNDQEGIDNFNQFKSDCEEGTKMGLYNVTSDTCDYTERYGDFIKNGIGKMNNGEFKVKFKNKGPDLKRPLKDFKNGIVFLDSNTNGKLDVGELIYDHTSADNTVKANDERLANHVDAVFRNGTFVGGTDPDKGLGPLVKMTDASMMTLRYFDEDDSGHFDVGETIYDDFNPPKKVSTMGMKNGDIRLVNARSVGLEFDDGSEVYKRGVFEDMTGKGNNGQKGEDIEIGMEERQFNITETLTLEVPMNMSDTNSSAAVFDKTLSSLASSLSLDDIIAEDPAIPQPTVEKVILFGDTIAPFVTYRFGIDIESCFWILGCITWFKLIIAITPFVITGFRLPGKVRVSGLPDRAFAEESFDITTEFETFDASYEDYIKICENKRNTLEAPGSYFGPNTPFDCRDFASYDLMSIPDVIGQISDTLEKKLLAASELPITQQKLNDALEAFLAVGKILFAPLPPLSVQEFIDRLAASDLKIGTDEGSVASKIQGQEVVLKVGVIIEVELVILNIELVDDEFRVEIDVLGLLQGFLLFNEIVKSSSPLIYNEDYAKKTCEPLLAGPGGFKGDKLVGFKSNEKFVDNGSQNGNYEKGESIYLDNGSVNGKVDSGDTLLVGDKKTNDETLHTGFGAKQKHTEDVNENNIFDKGESVYLDTGIPGSNISGRLDCNQAPGSQADYRAIWNLIRNYELMKEKNIIFTSFKAPFGFKEDGSIEGFPFLGGSSLPILSGPSPYNILYLRGNCIEAWNEGQILKIPAPGGPLPLCTGLWAPGLGQAIFGVQSNIGSLQIDAVISTEGDAAPIPRGGVNSCSPDFPDDEEPNSGDIRYCAYLDDPLTNGTKSSVVIKNITVDNYDNSTAAGGDVATIKIDDFKYRLQWIIIGDLLVHFENPGKKFLPTDMHKIKINMFTKSFDIIKIPQHPRVAGLEGSDVKVFNYALKVSDFDGDDPINRPNGTKPIKAENFTQPGLTSYEERSFANVTYRNIGNSLDTIQNLTISFPKLPLLNPNENDDQRWLSDPNQTEIAMMDVDPFNGTGSPAGSGPNFFDLDIAIKPARHYTTTPSFADNGDDQAGLYNVTVFASSANATKRMMNPTDPIPNFRINAPNIIQVNVTQFGNPVLNFTENSTETKPSKLIEYNAKIANFGNDFDVINFTQTFEDSNKGGCDLFAKGPDNSTCPFRANYTALQFNWTTSHVLCDYYWNETLPCKDVKINKSEPLPAQSPNYNRGELGLNVTESRNQTFTIEVPRDWAGIDDTLYQLKGEVVSMEDVRDGRDTKFLNHTVIATKESSVRYIALEIDAMKEKVTAANTTKIDKGSQRALTQILDRAIETAQERALKNVCADNFRGTNGALMTAQHQLEGMVRAINGMTPSNIRDAFSEELLSNANATINDIDDAMANGEESIVPCPDDSSKTTGNSKKDLDRVRIATEETTTEDSGGRGDQIEETPPSEDSVTSPSDVDLGDISKSSSSSSGDTTKPQIVSGIFSSTGLAETLTPDSDNTTPTIFETGKEIEFEFEFYENSGTGIEHFELVTKIPEHKTIYDSELWIEYNKGQKTIIHNPEGLWSSVSISVKGDGLNPKVVVSMVFDKPMDTSDVILRVWDAKRNSIDIEFEDVIKVIELPASEIIVTPEFEIDPEPILEIDPEPVFSWEKFNEWAGYSGSNLTDEEFLKHLEIDGNNIPSWIKQNNAKWVKQGLISQDELVIALENLENRGII